MNQIPIMSMAGQSVRYNLSIAYFLWFISGFGALGFHRFYLGKIGTGILWLLSGGLGGVGCIYDLVTLPRQVREANIGYAAREALGYDLYGQETGFVPRVRREDSPDRVILRLAKANNGMVTAGEVAIEANISIDEAQRQLDSLAKKNITQVRVRSSGVLVYFFPEFSKEDTDFIDYRELAAGDSSRAIHIAKPRKTSDVSDRL